MNVGIRELKAKLSEYIDRAARGETLTVTDRGRPVAILGPPLAGFDMDRAIEEGWLTPPKRVGGLSGTPRRFSAERSVQDVFDEDRGE